MKNGQIVIFGENQMVIGITHGKNEKNGGGNNNNGSTDLNNQDISRQISSRSEMIVMKFIEGTKKGEQL